MKNIRRDDCWRFALGNFFDGGASRHQDGSVELFKECLKSIEIQPPENQVTRTFRRFSYHSRVDVLRSIRSLDRLTKGTEHLTTQILMRDLVISKFLFQCLEKRGFRLARRGRTSESDIMFRLVALMPWCIGIAIALIGYVGRCRMAVLNPAASAHTGIAGLMPKH